MDRVPTVNPPGSTLRAETTDVPCRQRQNASNGPNHAQLEVTIAMVVNPRRALRQNARRGGVTLVAPQEPLRIRPTAAFSALSIDRCQRYLIAVHRTA